MPVRCYACGTQVVTKLPLVQSAIVEGHSMRTALDSVGLWRACCRRMILSQPTALDQLPFFVDSPEKATASS